MLMNMVDLFLGISRAHLLHAYVDSEPQGGDEADDKAGDEQF